VRSTNIDADRAWEAGLLAFEVLLGGIDGATWMAGLGFWVARCPSIPIPLVNGVWVSADELVDPNALVEAVGALERANLPSSVLFREGRAPRAEEAARATGRSHLGRIPIMVTTPGEFSSLSVAELHVSRADDAGSLAEAQRIAEEGFGTPSGFFAGIYQGSPARYPNLSTYLGRVAAEPVTTALAVPNGSTVGIFNVGTPPAHRRRGYGGAVTARAVADAFDEGASLAYLQASTIGEPVYRGIGFRQVDAIAVLDSPSEETEH
jgi:N-acetylglutamate synthase